MKSIQRYHPHPTRPHTMAEYADGEFIYYADHVREVAALREVLQRICELQSNYKTSSDVLWNYCLEHVSAALQSGKEE